MPGERIVNDQVLQRIRALGVVPVVVVDDVELAVPLAHALVSGGLPMVEVTFRTPSAARAISRIRAAVPEMLVGAGTLLDEESVVAAVDAGAAFGLSPGYDPSIVEAARRRNLPFLPGFATPSELSNATRSGVRALKFFPATQLGGPAMLSAQLAPFAHLGLDIIPTGGITVDSLSSWLTAQGVAAVGGTWIATRTDMAGRQWDRITQKAAAAVEAAVHGR